MLIWGGSAWGQEEGQGSSREGRQDPQTAAASEEFRKQVEEIGRQEVFGRGVSEAALLGGGSQWSACGHSWTLKQDEWARTAQQGEVREAVPLLGGGSVEVQRGTRARL